jgi:hypothetical protein
MSPSKRRFNAKAAVRFQNATLEAIRALKASKAAFPDFIERRHEAQIDKAIDGVLKVYGETSVEIDDMARQLTLPHTERH